MRAPTNLPATFGGLVRIRATEKLAAIVLLVGLALAPATLAQQIFEDSNFEGWSTSASDSELAGDVSGERVAGTEFRSYLVRHVHRRENPEDPGTLVIESISLAPAGVDASLLGMADQYRFELEIGWELDSGFLVGPLSIPFLFWNPVVAQGGELFRLTGANAQILPGASSQRVFVSGPGGNWLGGRAPDSSPGAPPIQFGVSLVTRVVPGTSPDVEARITLDNFVVERLGELPPLTVSFLYTYPPEPGSTTGLPSLPAVQWSDGQSAPRPFLPFNVGLNRPAIGEMASVTVVHPALFGGSSTVDLSRNSELFVELYSDGLATAGPLGRLSLVDPSEDLGLGEPNEVEVWLVPCGSTVGPEGLDCSCVYYLYGRLYDFNLDLTGTRASSSSTSGTDSETLLRQFRDERMSSIRTGRYYRDLYEATSPDLIRTLTPRFTLVRSIAETEPPWLAALDAATSGTGDQVVVTQDMVDGMLDIFDTFESASDERVRRIFRFERERLQLEDLPGMTIEEAIGLVEDRGGPPPCENGPTTLCLGDGRFRAEVFWQDFEGRTGEGRAAPLSDDSGTFWFFDQDNIELVVKVLDATALNDRFWVFYGALTNVEYTLTVTDTVTGAIRAYRNPTGEFASAGDTDAFTPDGNRPEGSLPPLRSRTRLLEAAADASVDLLHRGWRRLRTGLLGDPDARLHRNLAATSPRRAARAAGATCTPSPTALCLNGNRFRVEVAWRDFGGASGAGQARQLTPDTGTFWFFDAANTELILKVLDATAVNGRYWVFYGALSNVEYTITVTDTSTGATRTYRNPPGEFGSFGDTEAF